MRGDAMGDDELAQRVYDAYDALSPSEDAQMRVLEALRAHNGSVGKGEARKQTRRGRILWLITLPAAACLAVVALLGVSHNRDAASADSKGLASEERLVMEMEEADSYEDLSLAHEYPLVVVSPSLTLRVGDVASHAVDEDRAEEAVATNEEGTQEVPCWVVDQRYVRYEGDETWYEAAPAKVAD